ncbi:pyruvate kinase [Poriferisphaera sp. WC338]|uniref:pyruvate kinase n=1 Tax=Poriferisphaera sp. WC338 TaxID=3425129 RepID=UPI003D813B51
MTKILATVGPSCNTPEEFAQLIEQGARVARINFSHGTFDDFAVALHAVREASRLTGEVVGVLGDLSGPKIRVPKVAGDVMEVGQGELVEITGDKTVAAYRDEDRGVTVISSNYDKIVAEVDPGHRVLIDDGAVRLRVVDRKPVILGNGNGHVREEPRLICEVEVGGKVSNKKGINLPDSEISVPSLTDWDKECLKWAIANEVDYLALSFVRKAEDISELNRELHKYGYDRKGQRGMGHMPIVAKIETPQAIADLDKICEKSNAVMVARGDLGVEMDLAEVPVIQKQIIQRAHGWGKPVIVATQMLQSMIDAPVPTRAEVSDVAGAIMAGADAVMLSGETAVGKYACEAVEVMARTARITEAGNEWEHEGTTNAPKKLRANKYRTAALAHGVSVVVNDLQAKYVVVWTELGGTAQHISQNKLTVPIVALSSNLRTLRQMSLFFGVKPKLVERPKTTEQFTAAIDKLFIEENKWCDAGDPIVVCSGMPLGVPGVTNTIRIHYVGDVCKLNWTDADQGRGVVMKERESEPCVDVMKQIRMLYGS